MDLLLLLPLLVPLVRFFVLRMLLISVVKFLQKLKLSSKVSIVIKGADKESSVVVWDRADYILEVEKHLNDKRLYKEVNFNENIVTGLVEKCNKFLIVCAAID